MDNTILDQIKVEEYCSYKPDGLRKIYVGHVYFVIMNELYATQQHKITNNIIAQENKSEALDGLIETSGVCELINIKELLLLRYICTNYGITTESKVLLKGLGNNHPFSVLNQPTAICFRQMKATGRSRILAELKNVKKSFDR